jgi:hypothetical protein
MLMQQPQVVTGNPANRVNPLARSCERRSTVTVASEWQSEKYDSKIASTEAVT